MLEFVADDYEDANGFDRTQLQNFLRGYFLAHPKIELLVNIESLEFPADGLAQARDLRDQPVAQRSRSRAAQGGIPPRGRRLAGEARGPRAALCAPIYRNGREIPTFRERRHALRFNPDRIAPTTVYESAVLPKVARAMPDHRKPPLSKSSRPERRAAARGFARLQHREHHDAAQVRCGCAARKMKSRKPSASPPTRRTAELPRSDRPAGRVRHDERGVAVWDWAVATGEFATLSATRALKKLEVGDLKIEDTQRDAPSSASRRPAATRAAVSIPTTSAAAASARAKPPRAGHHRLQGAGS